MNSDPRLQYFNQVDRELALDLLNKIKDKQLLLVNYRLTPGLCKGLLLACDHDGILFEKILVDNCGVDDHMLSLLLQAVHHERKVQILVLKRCSIGPQSLLVF